jgi:hypothetical protein
MQINALQERHNWLNCHTATAKYQVLKAVSMKMAVIWVVVSCSLVKVYRRFRGVYCLHHYGEDKRSRHLTSQMSVNYTTTRSCNSEDSDLNTSVFHLNAYLWAGSQKSYCLLGNGNQIFNTRLISPVKQSQ